MKKRLDQLQFFRFLIFLSVILVHADTYTSHVKNIAIPISLSGMVFFFILSGFLTGYGKYGEAVELSLRSILTYVWRKLKKFYPIYLFSVIAQVVFTSIPWHIANFEFAEAVPDILVVLKHALLLQAWIPHGYFAYIGGSWFLSAILFLYVITLPLLKVLNTIKEDFRSRCKKLLPLLAVCLIYSLVFNRLGAQRNLEFFTHVFPLIRIGEYFAGMILGQLVRQFLCEKPDFPAEKKGLLSILEVCSLAFAVLLAAVFPPKGDFWYSRDVYWILPNMILITVFSFGAGPVSALFKNQHLVYLGDIAFECYILHTLVLSLYHAVSPDYGGITIFGNFCSFMFCLMTTVFLSTLIHKRKS